MLVEPLSPRELDVLRGMAEGLSNKQLARSLDISEHTVKFHINAILGKLGAQSRTEAGVPLWKRLAYVAITRAEKRLLWVVRNRLGRPEAPLGVDDLAGGTAALELEAD